MQPGGSGTDVLCPKCSALCAVSDYGAQCMECRWPNSYIQATLRKKQEFIDLMMKGTVTVQDSVTVTHATLAESISVLIKPGERVVSVTMLVPLGEEPFLHIPAAVQIAHDHWEKHFKEPIPQANATFIIKFNRDTIQVELYGPPVPDLPS